MKKIFVRLLSCFIPSKSGRRKFRNIYFPTVVKNSGKNNHFIVLDDNENEINTDKHKNLHIIFNGDNNTVKVHASTLFRNEIILTLESDNNIFAGKNCGLTINITTPMKACNLYIGNNVYSNGTCINLHDEAGLSVHIEDDVMFSYDTTIRPSDGYTIYDVNNSKILNIPAGIKIGKHCWLGMRTTVLKGANIPPNSIIESNSVYTKGSNPSQKDFSGASGGIFAGIPAKLIRTGVNWHGKHTDFFKDNDYKVEVNHD